MGDFINKTFLACEWKLEDINVSLSFLKEFWAGKDVRFSGNPADKLGEFLGRHVLQLTKEG